MPQSAVIQQTDVCHFAAVWTLRYCGIVLVQRTTSFTTLPLQSLCRSHYSFARRKTV